MAKSDGFIEKGISSSDKGTYIPPEKRMPYRPEYGSMSKADMQKDRDARKAKQDKVNAFAKSLDKEEAQEAVEEVKAEPKVKKEAKKKKA